MSFKGMDSLIHKILLVLFCTLLFIVPFLAQQVKTKKENGVICVYNPNIPSPPSPGPSRLSLKRDLILGANTDQEDYWFALLTSIAVDDSGNIYTLDPKEVVIRVFNSEGKLIRRLGNKGKGPGEFRGPAWLKISNQNELAVFDVLNHRFTYFDMNGSLLKTINANTIPFGRNTIDSKGNIYIHKLGRGPNGLDEMIKLNPSFKRTVTFASFIKKRTSRRLMNHFPTEYLFTISQNDKLFWLLSSSYTIHVVSMSGKELMRIIKKHDPIKITKQDKEALIEKEYAKLRDALKLKFEFPKYYPVASRIITDEKERIYVRTYEKDDQGGVFYDVFDTKGRYILRFALDEREEVEVAKKNRLYCRTASNVDGIPLLTRYIMEWK